MVDTSLPYICASLPAQIHTCTLTAFMEGNDQLLMTVLYYQIQTNEQPTAFIQIVIVMHLKELFTIYIVIDRLFKTNSRQNLYSFSFLQELKQVNYPNHNHT